jgi:type IV secretion system protein VirB1
LARRADQSPFNLQSVEQSNAMLDFLLLSELCAPSVHPDTMSRLVRIESSFNPFAIGVVGARLLRQPQSRDAAIATTRWLGSHGYNYSVGLAQINRSNFAAQGLDETTAFDPCKNLYAASNILSHCYRQALLRTPEAQRALRAALSCYQSGNFITGFRVGYVLKLVNQSPDTPVGNNYIEAIIRRADVQHRPIQARLTPATAPTASPKTSPALAPLR